MSRMGFELPSSVMRRIHGRAFDRISPRMWVLVVLAFVACIGGGEVPGKPVTPPKVDILEYPDLSDSTRMQTPTQQGERPRLLPRNRPPEVPAARKVPIKVHLPSGSGPFPVVVVSHGAGGDWDTHFAQAQDLAAHGYVVLCVEHVGSDRERLMQGAKPMKNLEAMIRDSHEVLTRPKDISFAIDQAARWNQAEGKLKGKFDLDRVGVMGHSFGAFTTMVVCGMRPALDWMTPRVEPGKGLGPDLRDARVKCGVALSPQGVGEPFFIEASFASLRVPLLGMSGTKDDQQAGQPAQNRKDAFALWPAGPHKFVWLDNAKHVDFSDSSGTDRRALPSKTRADVQPVTLAATLAFLDANLKGDAEAGKRVSVEGLKPLLRGEVSKVEVLSK